MTTKTVTGPCDICKAPIEGRNQRIFNQVLGFHKAKHHGIHQDRRAQARGYYYRKMGFSPAEIEAREAKYRNVPSMERPAYKPKRPNSNNTDATPVALKECPCCGAKFFAVVK